MNFWVVDFGVAMEYSGELAQTLDFCFIGIDWIIVRAISKNDAERQAELFKQGKHPIQNEINRNFRAIRVLAAEGEDKARKHFEHLYPKPKINNNPPDVYTLKLEALGYESGNKIRAYERMLGEEPSKLNRPWVAEIIGIDPKYKYSRHFIDHKTDYSEASGTGDRGVNFVFELSQGKIYEVKNRVSWKHTDRYFCRVEQGDIVKLTEQEVSECLENMGLA